MHQTPTFKANATCINHQYILEIRTCFHKQIKGCEHQRKCPINMNTRSAKNVCPFVIFAKIAFTARSAAGKWHYRSHM